MIVEARSFLEGSECKPLVQSGTQAPGLPLTVIRELAAMIARTRRAT